MTPITLTLTLTPVQRGTIPARSLPKTLPRWPGARQAHRPLPHQSRRQARQPPSQAADRADTPSLQSGRAQTHTPLPTDRIQGHHDQQSRHLDRSKPSAGTNAPKPTADGRSKPAEAAVAPIDEAKASRALVGRVLLRCSLDGSLLQGGKVLRYSLTLPLPRTTTLTPTPTRWSGTPARSTRSALAWRDCTGCGDRPPRYRTPRLAMRGCRRCRSNAKCAAQCPCPNPSCAPSIDGV